MNEKSNKTHKSVSLIIETPKGWILQKRDDIDGIWSPGKVNQWGGAFEPEDEDDPRCAALRELREETALEEGSVDLEQFLVEDYLSTSQHGEPITYHCYCFIVRIKDESRVFVHEGQGSVLIPFDTDLDDESLNLSSFVHHLLITLKDR